MMITAMARPCVDRPFSHREKEGPARQAREDEGFSPSTAKPLTLPTLRAGPLPLPMGEGIRSKA